MKTSVIFLLIVATNYVFSQNIIKQKYDELFPNTKKKQIERLNIKLDSIILVKDNLSGSLSLSNEIIIKQNHDLKSMHLEIENLRSRSESSREGLLNEIQKLNDSINYLNFFNVVSIEEMMPRNTGEEPLIINTSNWRNYKIIETGTSDYRGRYSWITEIFKKEKDSLIPILITDLFKSDKLIELETLINSRLKEDFSYLIDANRNCFPRHFQYPGFLLKDMRFMISDNSEISFEVIYGLSSTCFAVNAASASFKIKEMVPYLKVE